MRTLGVLIVVATSYGCGGGGDDSQMVDDPVVDETWTSVDISAVGVPQDVWVFAQDDVWIAGQRGLAHWNGVETTLVTTGAPSEMVLGYVALWGNAPNDLWAVGGSYISHWDGSTWTVRSGGDLEIQPPRAVYADGATVWVGGSGESGSLSGSTWTTYPVGATDLWGTGGVIYTGLQRFSDGQWTPLANAPSGAAQIWGLSPDDVWVATNDSSITHCASSGCTTTALELGSQGTVAGVFARAANDVYAVGYRRTIVHYDGSEWRIVQQQPTTSTTQLYTIHGGADGTLWTVGVVGAGNPTALRNR